MKIYTTNGWSYNRYFKINKKIGKAIYSLPIFIMVVWYGILLAGLLVLDVKISFIFISILSIVSIMTSLILKIQIDREILDKRTPIKVKITDDAIYFTSVSGKIKEIRLENIELVMLDKTFFGNGAIVKIIERISGNRVKHHYFYLDEDLGKAIRDAHSKYVEYGFKVDNK